MHAEEDVFCVAVNISFPSTATFGQVHILSLLLGFFSVTRACCDLTPIFQVNAVK